LIRDARLYHISNRPDGVHWDGIEYLDPDRGNGVVFAFRGTVSDENNHTFRLMGLDPKRRYRLHYQDGSSPDSETEASTLLQSGLAIHLPSPLSSELVFFEPVDRSK
jgi:ribulose bisphosphate carboxylase small subunit